MGFRLYFRLDERRGSGHSLIWDPRELPIQRQWFDDGPFVKIEFVRQSKDERITLVIDDTAMPVRALWAAMDTTDMNAARDLLRRREGTSNIEHIGHWSIGQPAPHAIPGLAEWAPAHGLEAIVWTALPPKFKGIEGRIPQIGDVLEHLRNLAGAQRDNAERYVRLAPKQIDTKYRRRIEADLGWSALDRLPA